MRRRSSLLKSMGVGLTTMLVVVVFAYGFEITQIDLEELRSEQRQASLVRVLRTLAQPDFVEYEQEEQWAAADVFVPCPAAGIPPGAPVSETSAPFISVTPTCAQPGELVQVEGFNFRPNAFGPVRFVPGGDPTNPVQLGRESARTDGRGHF